MHFLVLIPLFLFSALSYATEDPHTIKNTKTGDTDTALEARLEYEDKAEHAAFGIIPHKPTYLLPFSYNDKIKQYDLYGEDAETQQLELEFQISFKMPLLVDIADSNISLFFAYSQVSFWQAYNFDNSSPFRETNYEPELFAQWDGDVDLGAGWKFKVATFGFTHQSNGRAEPLSRSWNRLESRLVAEQGNLVVAFNPWYRLEETDSKNNNPDLLDYFGHGQITAAYKLDEHTFSVSSRNNIESGFSKGSIEGTWSFPIHGKIRGYFKAFSGYGNSLIEYNYYTNTVGLGISMTDWL